MFPPASDHADKKTMSQDKKTSEVPATFVITGTDAPTSAMIEKKRNYKKYAIGGVILLVVIAIVITAILVGMYMFTEAQKDIINFTYKRDNGVTEEVNSDPNTNIVQFHANNPDYEIWVVNDFNKDIQVLKVQSDKGVNCYVTPLNRTIATDPSKIRAPTDNPLKKQNTTYLNYRSGSTTISDSSFLSKTAKDTCKGISTYWIYPSCEDPDHSDPAGRNKRGGGCSWCCCYYCWWWFCGWVCWC